jgi:hypothetical protein
MHEGVKYREAAAKACMIRCILSKSDSIRPGPTAVFYAKAPTYTVQRLTDFRRSRGSLDHVIFSDY